MRHRYPQPGTFQRTAFLLVLAVLIVAAIVAVNNKPLFPTLSTPQAQAGRSSLRAHVVRVYDGDTIKLSNGEKVRFIGIDAPELHDNPKLLRDAKKSGMDIETIKRMGARSYEYARGLLADRDVRLEFDTQPRDKYGRLLAYVYVDDGTFVNEEIIKNGYAYPMTIRPNTRHATEFRSLFEQAQENKLGLWSK